MNTLLYLSYGEGLHQQEVICSFLSALRHHKVAAPFQTLVYTDCPEVFERYPVRCVKISPETWDLWSGKHQFAHRRKILALQHCMNEYGGKVVLLDGDTWLRRPAGQIFDRIGQGKTVMHIQEGRVADVQSDGFCKLRQFLETNSFRNFDESALDIPTTSFSWNAGVVGLHVYDAPLLEKVVHLTDQFSEKTRLHVLEQFAFSFIFATRTLLQGTSDLVFHYWPPYLHKPFRERLPQLIEQSVGMPIHDAAEFLFRHRPRPTAACRCRVVGKRILQFLGLIRGRCASNEW